MDQMWRSHEQNRRGKTTAKIPERNAACFGMLFFFRLFSDLGLSENVVYTPKPNGFADHYPYEKWLFHWE